MSAAGRLIREEANARLGALSARARASTRDAFDIWRGNLPEGWWISLACAGTGMFVLALIRVLISGFA